MAFKSASKDRKKPKTAFGGAKPVHSVKGAKAYGLKMPAATTGSKVTYGAHKASAMKMHDAALAVIPFPETETTPAEHETELAERLVDEISDQSADVNALCETYQLRREELARLTGFSLRALAEWASGKLPSQPAKRRLHEVRRLLDALAEIVKRERIPEWLHRRNAAFDNLTPLQVIEFGEMDRLWAMVYDLTSGQPA